MSTIKNLWSSDLLNEEDVILPVTILQEQASYLNNMTKNIVVAKINTVTSGGRIPVSRPNLIHILQIFAPAMGNYDFELVRLIQEQVFPYPLIVVASLTEIETQVENSEELEIALAKVFNDKKTVSAIQSLIVQSKQYVGKY